MGVGLIYDHFKYDREIERTQKRILLNEVLRQEQSQERRLKTQDLEEYRAFLAKVQEVNDLIRNLDERGLANGELVEQSFMDSISKTHRLGFEEQKLMLLESSD